jgi:hypothetical protein
MILMNSTLLIMPLGPILSSLGTAPFSMAPLGTDGVMTALTTQISAACCREASLDV